MIIETNAFFDLHCHLRDPGQTQKEDIESGTEAAEYGGYGAVVCMPNTSPVCDCADIIKYIKDKAAVCGHAEIYPAAAITKKSAGEELCDYKSLKLAGAVAFTDDGRPVSDSLVMYQAMKKCAEYGYLIISHPEELKLAKNSPALAESVMIARDLLIAEETGCRLHIAHVSSEKSLSLIRNAKRRKLAVTAETCPHYFSLTNEDFLRIGTNAQMNPPLMSERDRLAVIEAIIDNTIDCISTDHAPHTSDEKNSFTSPNGIIGLQSAFAVSYTYLVKPGYITLEKLFGLMSSNPAKIIGIEQPKKKIKIDTDKKFIFNSDKIKGKSKNTPYDGFQLYGEIIY